MTSGCCRRTSRDHPLPERQRLGVRVVDPEDLHAVLDPEQHHVAQRVPDRRIGVAVEVQVDDVLVFLRRVLGELDGAVRPPVEPLRMLLDPRMVGRALDGEVERDLQPVRMSGLQQPLEILERAELRMDGGVAAFLGADGIGAARIVRTGGQAVVAALAVGAADRVDRQQVEHVEAHLAHIGQAGDHVVEGAVAVRRAALRARHQLIPGGIEGGLPVDDDSQLARIARHVGAVGAAHDRHVHLVRQQQLGQLLGPLAQSLGVGQQGFQGLAIAPLRSRRLPSAPGRGLPPAPGAGPARRCASW